MPQFKCTSCGTGFYSAASLSALNDKTCSACGSYIEPTDEPIARPALEDRLGHLIARREVARAQARVDSERWAGAGERVGAGV